MSPLYDVPHVVNLRFLPVQDHYGSLVQRSLIPVGKCDFSRSYYQWFTMSHTPGVQILT